jgi:hypothetical protein
MLNVRNYITLDTAAFQKLSTFLNKRYQLFYVRKGKKVIDYQGINHNGLP